MVETNVRQFWGVDTEPVGRARELIELETMLDSAGGGSGSVVVIEGEAGIGKSHLLAAAMRSAERAGFATFHGRAEEFELGRPFGALIDAFDLRSSTPPPESDDLRRLLFADGLGPSIDAQHFRFQIVDAIVDTVEQLSRAGPTALVLDDLQWADPTTLLALGSVARRVGTLPVVVVAATRPYDLTSDLSRLVDRLVGDGHGHLPLDGLDPDAVAEIATQLVGSRPGPRLLEQAARAGGNPFFLIQLLSSLREEGEIVAGDDGTAEYRGEALPRQLRATVERRLGRLSNEAHEVLRVGAVLGSSFPISPVAEVLDTTVLDLINPVQELVASGMLLDQDRTLTFRHDLLRSAVYEAVPSSTRAGLHRAVGRALATTGAPAVEVAEHFLETALPGDALAAEWARQAAGELLTADAGAAVDLLDRALDLCGGVAKCTAAIEVDRARALVWSGRFAEAEVALRATIGHLDDDDELERQSLAALAHVLFEQARWSDLITELGPLVDDPDLPELFADRMRARLASAYAAIHDAEGARKHASAVLESQASSGDPIARCEAYIALSMASGGSEAATTAVAHARRAVAEAARDGTWEAYRRHPHITLAAALKRDDRVEAALTSLEEGRRISGTLMSSWDDSMYFAVTAMAFFNLGRWDDAEAEIDAGLERCELSGARVATPLLHMTQMAISIRRGELDKASACLEAAHGTIDDRPGIGATQLLRHWGLLLAARGDDAGAFAKLNEAWNLDEHAGWVYVAHDLIQVAKRLGRHEVASPVVERLQGVAEVVGSALTDGIHLQCRGAAFDQPDDLVRAAELFRRIGMRPILAFACGEAGRLLVPTQPHRARTMLEEAEAIWEELRAVVPLAEVRRQLDALGDRRERPAAARPVSGWKSLTKSELRVARLVATGLTNAEVGRELYISPRTVESHLGRAFAKLQIKSRVELAVIAQRHEPTPEP